MKHLSEGHCRMGTQVTVASGAKVSCACGRLSDDCKRHKTKRESGRYARFEVGFYPIVFSSQGHQSHGKIGTQYLSEADMEEQIQEDLDYIRWSNRKNMGFRWSNRKNMGSKPMLPSQKISERCFVSRHFL